MPLAFTASASESRLPLARTGHFLRALPQVSLPLESDHTLLFSSVVVRKLQEFELPYVSVTSLRSHEYKIVLRKRSGLGLSGRGPGLDCWATRGGSFIWGGGGVLDVSPTAPTLLPLIHY